MHRTQSPTKAYLYSTERVVVFAHSSIVVVLLNTFKVQVVEVVVGVVGDLVSLALADHGGCGRCDGGHCRKGVRLLIQVGLSGRSFE